MNRITTHIPRRRGVRRLAAAGVAGSMLLAACGSSDSEGSSESTDAEAAATEVTCESVDEVKVVLQWVTQSQFAGYYAALDTGVYDRYCLDVTIQEGGVNVVPQQVLGAGEAEFAVSHVVKSASTREEGGDIVNISQVFQRGGYYQVAWADSGITSLPDLAGVKVGSWGFGNELVLYAAMRATGIEPEVDAEIIQQPFDMSLLLNREVDAAQAKSYNEYAQLLEATNPDTGELYQPEDFSIIDLNEEGFATLEDGIYARGEWLDEGDNSDIATRFLAASFEGWAFCRDYVDDCVDIVLDNGSTLGQGHMTWMLNEVNKLIWPAPEGIGYMDTAMWDASIQIAIDGGVLSAPADESAYRTDLNDDALVLAAEAGVEVLGNDYEPIVVEITPGGE